MKKNKIPSSKKQRQLIAIACAHFRIEKEDKQTILMERYGKPSTVDITFAQAEDLIDDFVKKGFHIQSQKRPYFKRKRPQSKRSRKAGSNITYLATQAELSKIDALSGLIQWKVEDGITRWMEKRFKIKKIKTSADAFQVIEGLKGMFNNQMKKLYGPDWYLRDYSDNIEVCSYIAEHFPKGTPSYIYMANINRIAAQDAMKEKAL